LQARCAAPNLTVMKCAQQTRQADLRRKITLLREYLRQGEETEMALDHLREIAAAEAELRRIAVA